MDKKLINYVLLIEGLNAYYFDENGRFSIIERSLLNKIAFPNIKIPSRNNHIKVEIAGITEYEYIKFALNHLDVGDSFEKLIDILHSQETKKNFLVNYVIKGKDTKSYFFNEKGIFSSLPYSESVPPKYKNVVQEGKLKGVWTKHIPLLWNNSSLERLKYIVNLLNVGDSFEKFCNLIDNPNITYPLSKQLGVNQFITSISQPNIRRSADNFNKNTFDFIDIEIFFKATMEKEAARSFILEHFHEIFDKAKEQLKKSIPFRKYGVSSNFLKCSYKIDFASSSIHFIFSLKELPEHNKDDSNIKSENSDQIR